MSTAAQPVLSAARRYFLGPAGTFCHAAARAFFGDDTTELRGLPHIEAVFEALAADPDAVGVVPVENVIEGSVNLTLDALLRFDALHVVGEQIIPIEQCLLLPPAPGERPSEDDAAALAGITAVHSHPHALAQCRRWLSAHLPHATWVHTGSTAAAAHAVADLPGAAAIGSALAGELAGLQVLRRGLQGGAYNATRFLVLGRAAHLPAATGQDRTSVVFGTAHTQGALYRTLGLFAEEGVNLCRIESRPMVGEAWQYVFLADLVGHQRDLPVQRVLAALAERGVLRRVLGSYQTR